MSRDRLRVVADAPLAAILLVALAVRVAIILATPHFIPVTDAGEFDSIAKSLADTGGFPPSLYSPHGGPTALRPPLFPGVLAILYKIVGTGSAQTRWDAGRGLEAVLGVIVVLLVYLIAKRLFSRRVGLVAAAITAVWPPLVMVGSSLLSESLFVPLLLAAVWAALVYRDQRRLRWVLAAGVFTGLSALTRGNGLLMFLPVGLIVWTERGAFSKHALRAPVTVVLAMVVVLVPWTIRNYAVFHEFVPVTTEPGYILAGTYNASSQDDRAFPSLWRPPLQSMRVVNVAYPHSNEAQFGAELLHQAFHYWRHHPLSVIDTVYWNTLRWLNLTGTFIERAFAGGEGYPIWLAELSVYAMWALLVVLVITFAAPPIRRSVGRIPLAVWGPVLVVYATTVPLLGLTRYRAPADAFLIMIAAVALSAAYDVIFAARPALAAQRELA
ncbi:MAG: ArnT family glycosyltransferase [Solirubrobacteraceae bacterium]